MPNFFQKKEKRNLEKPKTAKSHWEGFLKALAYVFLAAAIFLCIGGVFWQRAGIELTSKNVSGMSQREVLWKLLVEYITDPGTITGFASLALSIVVFSFERRHKEQERDKDINERLERMRSLPYLQRLRKFIELEKEGKEKSWSKNRVEDLQKDRNSILEYEFWWEVGDRLQREDNTKDLSDIQYLYNYFFVTHTGSVDVLARILASSISPKENVFTLISAILKLWDDFDVNVKDVIVGALKKLSQTIDLTNISKEELAQVFQTAHRRRLLRETEIRALFPQLGYFPPAEYDAIWRHLPRRLDNPKILDWLKLYSLVSNPFGPNDLKNHPFYPEGFAYPHNWEEFLDPFPQGAQCPTPEDTRALAFLMRSECLPTRKTDAQGKAMVDFGKQVFPVWIVLQQSAPLEVPLITLAKSAARTWLDILPFSPDAMLDLPPAKQDALLELLFWAFGSGNTVIDLLKRVGIKSDKGGTLLIRKIEQFQSGFSSAHFPQDAVLLSWLKVRPPDLSYTYLILLLDEFPAAARSWWLEQFGLLIPTLSLNGLVTKMLTSGEPILWSLPVIQLNWSAARLKTSLNTQFEAAMDKKVQEEMGTSIDFRSMFGSDTSIGYFETEANTTDKLISASHNSLARMLTLGNRLLQYHCEHRQKDGVPEKYLYVEDLDALLNSA